MANQKTDADRILDALRDLKSLMEDLFILQASQAGIKSHGIRALLAIDMGRVTRIAKHIKKGD